ncbi:MAG TPA: insulinase family protein [Thermoanaerobaculia bacterium]|nr:insulinase family protein [Thermoanaerobaculia bacterium]
MRRLAAILLLTGSLHAQDVQLPYRLITLENGLQVVIQPDPSMPSIGVEYWIRGGSREEATGQHGIAHLFEHNVPYSSKFNANPENRALRSRTNRGGGAGTEPDFLRFYSYTMPEGLEAALAAAAGRLESEQEGFTAENVARDQDIVISELRRGGNIDWDLDVLYHLHRGTFGADHPYGHAVSGNEADVRAATVGTMRDWHRRFSGAASAILFLVGNFDPAKAEPLIRKHFGPIPPGTRPPQPVEVVPPARARRDVLEKDVTMPIVYMRWPVPAWGSADGDYLTLLAHILTNRMKDSTASVQLLEIAGTFGLRGAEEAPMREALAKLLRDGVTDAELARAKTIQQTDFVRLLQRGVWRSSRADAIGFGLMFRGNADTYREQLARTENATPAQVNDAARRWLSAPGYVLQVLPRPKRSAAGTIDRSATINPGDATPATFPTVERKTLANGLPTILIRRDALPLAQITIAYPPGTDVDALRRTLATDLSPLGAEVTTRTDPDYATLSINVLSSRVNEALTGARASRPQPAAVPAAGTPIQQRDQALSKIIGEPQPATTIEGAEALILSGNLKEIPTAASQLPLQKTKPTTTPLKPAKERFVIVDFPTTNQAHMLLAWVLPPSVAKDPLPADFVTTALRTRLMNNLRTAKGWSYEVFPYGAEIRRGGAIARFNIPVQTEKTAEAIAEIKKEIADLRDKPVSAEFLGQIRSYVEGGLTGGLSSLAQLNLQALDLVRNDLPADAHAKALARLQTFSAADLQNAAKALMPPGELIWIIAGERTAIERELQELGVPFELHEAR